MNQLVSSSLSTSATKPTAEHIDPQLIQLGISAVIIVVMVTVPGMLGYPYLSHIGFIASIYIGVVALQNILLVNAGQVAFGMGAIFGLGAYTAAIVTQNTELPYWVSVVAGVLAATAGGMLFALPALRVQHYYLGFVTLCAALVFPELLVIFHEWTNGITGISIQFPRLRQDIFLGISPLALITSSFAVAMLALNCFLKNTRLGRGMIVAATSPEAAQSLGISHGFMRFSAFVIVSALTGLGGTLFFPTVGFVGPDTFTLELSIMFFFAVVVGGRGQTLGPVAGVALLYLLPNVALAEFVNFRLIIYGLLTLLVVLLMPDGLIGTLDKWLKSRRHNAADLSILSPDSLMSWASDNEVRAKEVSGEAPLLSMSGGRKSFGSVHAIDGVDAEFRAGEVHAIVGANGSGKTSLLNVITGLTRMDAGRMTFLGHDVSWARPTRIAKLGLGRTFQVPRVFDQLSVWGNLRVGLDMQYRDGTFRPEHIERARQALDRYDVDNLSHAQRRIVELMRVLLRGPAVILLDEPAAGLSPSERTGLGKLLQVLAHEHGKAIVLVEHDLGLIWGIADRVTVLDAGKVVASGAPEAVAANPIVRSLFVELQNA